jgi:NADPH:quinone reductase
LDAAEAVSVALNYITAYQMLHRSAKVKPGVLGELLFRP